MDLSTIKKKIESGVSGDAHTPGLGWLLIIPQMIRTDIEFQRDMLLMFQNAFMYNNTEHEVWVLANVDNGEVKAPHQMEEPCSVLCGWLIEYWLYTLPVAIYRYFMAQEMKNDVMENIQVQCII